MARTGAGTAACAVAGKKVWQHRLEFCLTSHIAANRTTASKASSMQTAAQRETAQMEGEEEVFLLFLSGELAVM